MKAFGNGDLSKFSSFLKISAFLFVSFFFFYLGKHWSDNSYDQLIFFSSRQSPTSSSSRPPSISLSPNLNKTFDPASLINGTSTTQSVPDQALPVLPQLPVADSPPPPPPALQRMGVVDENGVMTDDFEVGEYDPEMVENWGSENETVVVGTRIRVKKFGMCPKSMREYIPCLDNAEVIQRLKSTEKGEKFERHCPEPAKSLSCLVPPPNGYKVPIQWPNSRDEVWFSNVPHAQLAEYKGGQNWITVDKDKFRFPGGGTQFIHGAYQYLDQISKMVPDIAFGRHTRVVLDVGCGVASFGAYLFSRDVLTMSIAPKDVHENQIQFALERGVPAMVAAFATRRLLYPSQAFELIHCSRCRVNWARNDGILLLEVNRLLRAGGYFAWAAQPVYKHEAILEEQCEGFNC